MTKAPSPSSSTPSNKRDLTQGPLGAHLARLSIPMVWGIAALISFQLVDTYFISLLGTQELAAISFTQPVTYFVFTITLGFGIAMSSVLSRLIGEKDMETGRRVVVHGLILVFQVACVIALLGIAAHDRIFSAMGADAEMLDLIRNYMMLWFAGAVFLTVPLVGNSAIRATGDTLSPALVMSIVAVVNVILDPIMIFGLFGFPRLEMLGAALATLIANMMATGAALYILIVKKQLFCGLESMTKELFRDSARRLSFIALPAGLTNAVMPVVNGIIIGVLSIYGAETVAAYGVVNRIEAFAMVILMALSTGMAPIIGQNWGARQFGRVNETLRLAIGFNVIWSLFVAALLFVFGRPIAGLFSNDAQVIETVLLFFMIVPVSYALGNIINGWSSAFNAMGKPQYTVIMTATKFIVLLIPAVYIGEHLGGVTGVFVAIALVNAVSGLGFHLWCRTRCKRYEQDALAAEV